MKAIAGTINTKEDVERLEKLMLQLKGLHMEISQLAKKSPNDGLNVFKLKFVNKVLENGNLVLAGRYRPFEDFDRFELDSLPTNSDVTMIIAQYIEQAELFRSDNVKYNNGRWRYIIKNAISEVEAKAPTRVGGEK